MTHIAIVGTGLAGSSLTQWLLTSKFDGDLTLFDARDPMTASVGPTLLCHPFPGRSLAPHPYLHKAIDTTVQLLKTWKTLAPKQIRPTTMWRPLKGTNLKRLSQSHQDWWLSDGKHTYRNTWRANPPAIEYTTPKDIERIPAFNTPYSALKTEPAFAIDAGELFPIVHESFRSRGVSIIQESVTKIIENNNRWQITTCNTRKSFDQVVLAFGRQSRTWFPHLDIALQSGSLMKATPAQTSKIESLSLNGLHIGQHNDEDWVFGSTRWSSTQPTIANEKHELLKRLRETLPCSPDMQPNKSSIWSGTRTIYGSDRMPLCGELPQHRNIFVLTALGSKGWLWGPWTAKLLQTYIQFGDRVNGFESVDLMRANAEDGWYSPYIGS